ncbi:hypothetical protein [Streptomyces bobili]|uniref:hypothetical protein n=1 Tax=Streptomyces bobili TaxID=67280 RepID=UPI00379DBD3D
MQGEWGGEVVGPDVWETCRELIPAGSVFAILAEHREVLFPPGMFTYMYPPANGRPSLPPQVLSDFETVQKLLWNAACGLGLYDTALDPSLLTYFRRRLRHSADPMRIVAKVKEVVTATGVLRGRQRRALDSTVLYDAVAIQDPATRIISAVRRVIREVPGAGETASEHCRAHDYTDLGEPKSAWADEVARTALVDALVDALVADSCNLLGHRRPRRVLPCTSRRPKCPTPGLRRRPPPERPRLRSGPGQRRRGP